MDKMIKIILNAIPIIIMIMLIPVISNDYWLAATYIIVIIAAFLVKREKNDFLILIFGFFIMTVSEYIFISTGVEKFMRNSLFGLMPVWLPVLWAYAFVAIKRSIEILNK